MLRFVAFLVFGVCFGLSGPAHAFAQWSKETASSTCSSSALPLAFWLGRWDVYVDGKLDGHNVIESALHDCEVIEHWDDVSGMQGMSLFYFEPHAHQWKQVWVTDRTFSPGGVKEKALVYSSPDEVRFQGTVWLDSERMILDRTTLRKLDHGLVSQLIEYSKDGGSTWIKSYDAIYRPAAPKQAKKSTGNDAADG